MSPQRDDEELGALRGGLRLGGVEDQQRRAEVEARLFGLSLEPVRVGRYAIVRKLGAGGMGVVYVAYDERLDRRVALKLLRSDMSSPKAMARLEREAQAMARLSHPNVLTIHEVGTHADQVFMAMEFVEGLDLRDWLTAEARPWRAVVEHFIQAGEGLAAAHAAGVVHRDFKPDNVLVGGDGRVRVADFGLAHSFGAPREADEGSAPANEPGLTWTGSVAGTPAYMPPEQYLGGRSDARSDQFSFCVALWEGLYGQRPFLSRNLVGLADAIMAGEIDEPSDDRGVPPWLRAAVLRGLARDPDQRWPSMRALLDALGDDPRRRWRRFGVALGVGLGSLALLVFAGLAMRSLQDSARQRYFSGFTAGLLEIERDRGLLQAQDDAARARDATRMSVVRSLERAPLGGRERERELGDPAAIAALLREVEGESSHDGEWLSAANRVLGEPLSHALLRGHRGEISALVYARDGSWLASASTDGEVWRWTPADARGEPIYRHEGEVTQLIHSDDGRWLASASTGGEVRLWSLRSQTSLVLRRGSAEVRALAFDPRGRWLAAGSADGELALYDLEGLYDLEELEELGELGEAGERGPTLAIAAHQTFVLALAFDPSGSWLLTGSSDKQARLWRLDDLDGPVPPQPAAVLGGHDDGVYFVALPSAQRAVTAADDGTARVWTLHGEAGRDPAPASSIVARHPQAIAAMAIHGEQIATGSLDGSVRVGSLFAPHDSVALPGHSDQVWGVAFIDEGRQVVSASFDRRAQVSRADGRGEARELVGHAGSIYTIALDGAGRYLATGAYDSEIRIWDLERPQLTTPLRGHADTVFSVEVDAAGARAVTASHDGSAQVWSVAEGVSLARLDARGSGSGSGSGSTEVSVDEDLALNHALLTPDGTQVATARNDGRVSLWTVADGRETVLGELRPSAWSLAFDESGRRLAAGFRGGQVRVWDLEDPKKDAVALHGHELFISAVAFERGGAGRVVTASGDGSVRVWSPETGAALATLPAQAGKIYALVQSPDGRRWATGGEDGSVQLWPSLEDDAAPRRLVGHDKAVWSLAFDADGQRLVSGGHDGRALVWGVDEGRLIDALEGHGGKVWDVAVLPDARVVTASGDGGLRIWTPESGAPALRLDHHGADIQSLAVGLGGQRVISASADATAMIWRVELTSVDPEGLLARLWQATSACLSAQQRRRELGETREEAEAGAAACEQAVARARSKPSN
ncbi:protein kinase [Pseudenhygromyxa sp. WMMC2535]|uniref:WD40 repeat domain-containing serine/threonine protein kinase n=1 Tax=Pseudenhygromyxa sp. WMMC2535 TaxID=2712867 RepID=UPI001551880E|nr:protein kinase [Pseudenhygromyxa sp. WMMC2535]NVB41252.1 protein kinase [Pseudenhygromyxa sp. WMMC2535]